MYKVVYSRDSWLPRAISDLEEKINKLKAEGWKEQGGISITCEAGMTSFCAQAMTKDEDDDLEPVVDKGDIVISSLS